MLFFSAQVVLLADGIPCIIGGLSGWFVSDKTFAACPGLPTSRLSTNLLVALFIGPHGVLAVGWALHAQAHLAVVTNATGIACIACNFYLPALFSYITAVKQSASAAASTGVLSVMVLVAALVVTAGSAAAGHVGYGWWFTILACIQGMSNLFAYVMIIAKKRAAQQSHAALPAPAATVLIDEP